MPLFVLLADLTLDRMLHPTYALWFLLARPAAIAISVVVLRVLVHPIFDRALRGTASIMAQIIVPPVLQRDSRELIRS